MPSSDTQMEDPPPQPDIDSHNQSTGYTPADLSDKSIILPPRRFNGGRLRLCGGYTPTAASFEIDDEDHTLGNVLRWVIARNPDVEFVGYTIPHPSDAKMHLRIQTYDDVNVIDVLEKGLDELMGVCDVVADKFEEARGKAKA